MLLVQMDFVSELLVALDEIGRENVLLPKNCVLLVAVQHRDSKLRKADLEVSMVVLRSWVDAALVHVQRKQLF